MALAFEIFHRIGWEILICWMCHIKGQRITKVIVCICISVLITLCKQVSGLIHSILATGAVTHLDCLQRWPQSVSKCVWVMTIWSRGRSAYLGITKSFPTSGQVELLRRLLQEVNTVTPYIPFPFKECAEMLLVISWDGDRRSLYVSICGREIN